VVACLALTLGPWTAADDPAKQGDPAAAQVTSSRLTDEKYKQVKKGMAIKELSDLLGPPTRVRTYRTDTLKDIVTDLVWEDASRVRVMLRDGKVEEVSGAASPTLSFGPLTPDHVLKVRPGMSEGEVSKLLGPSFGEVKAKDQPADVRVLVWSPLVSVRVVTFEGKANGVQSFGSQSFTK
jgi:hypothetical protein